MTITRILIAFLALGLSAEEPAKPPVANDPVSADNRTAGSGPIANVPKVIQSPTVEHLQAKIAHLEAQLAELRLTFQYEQQVCSIPDMMRAKLASAEAAAKLPKPEAAKP